MPVPQLDSDQSHLPHILIIDDNQAIHRDFDLAFLNESHNPELQAMEALVFAGESKPALSKPVYAVEHALSGMEGVEKVRQALARRYPFQLAFVDIRMPGIDGVETVRRLWELDPSIQVVIVTAYSDYSWDDLTNRLGHTDKLLVLKKPFEYIEVVQMASALTEKWFLTRQAALRLEQMELLVARRTQQLLDRMTLSPVAGPSDPAPLIDVASPAGENELPLVLLVQSNADLGHYVAEGLGPEYRVLSVPKYGQGLEKAREMVPDIVITDISATGNDGQHLCQALKGDELAGHIPIVVLGADGVDGYHARALEAGADDFISKPFSPALLKTRLDGLLQSRRRWVEQFQAEPCPQPRDLATNQADAQFLRRTTEIVEKHLADFEFDVEELAQKLFISRRQLLRKLKAVAGCTPNVFLRRLRLKRAAELLRDSGMTVSEITYAVGFSDLKHFRALFREEYGVPPAEYARKAE